MEGINFVGEEEMDQAVVLFREYMGTGLILAWFLLSLIYLFLRENKKPIRILFVYVPVVILLLFFNPLFVQMLGKYLGDEIYYRILWLLPVTPVLAYTIVHICVNLRGKARLVFTLGAVCGVILSGSYIYGNRFFTKAENLYHVPECVVEICDAIRIPGREVMAVFPLNLVQYVRQYSPVVCMPYGREMLVDTWNEWDAQHDLCDAMEADVIDAAELGYLARESDCLYIILPEDKKILGSLKDENYAEFARIQGYCVYKDMLFEQ